MEDYVNSKLFNRIAWGTTGIMIALTGMFIVTMFV